MNISKIANLIKKALTLSLCVCMMTVMATGASAVSAQPRSSYELGKFYYWSPQDSNQVLNIWGNNTVYDTAPVTLYRNEGQSAQRFAIAFSGIDYAPRVFSEIRHTKNGGYFYGSTLNLNSEVNPKCTMWTPTQSNPNRVDSEIDYISSTGELKLVNRLSANAPRQLIHSGEAAVGERRDCSWILAAPTSSQKWNLK